MTTAVYELESESYCQHGGFNEDFAEWADTFRKLGGEKATFTPAWRYGLEPGSGVFLTVVGSDDAVAFVEQTLAP